MKIVLLSFVVFTVGLVVFYLLVRLGSAAWFRSKAENYSTKEKSNEP